MLTNGRVYWSFAKLFSRTSPTMMKMEHVRVTPYLSSLPFLRPIGVLCYFFLWLTETISGPCILDEWVAWAQKGDRIVEDKDVEAFWACRLFVCIFMKNGGSDYALRARLYTNIFILILSLFTSSLLSPPSGLMLATIRMLCVHKQ